MKKLLCGACLSIMMLVAAEDARAQVTPAGIPNGGSLGHTRGFFGPVVDWPIIGLHAILLPDGRVLTYGTDEQGQQTGQLVYDVWDRALGTGTDSHTILPNTTGTDLFCSAQTILSNGQVLLTGGDRTINGVRNYSTEQSNIFDPATNTLRPNGAMSYARWYPTIVRMPNGDAVILGGRQEFDIDAPTPEVFNLTTGWRLLSGATSVPAYGFPDGNWYYPRAFVTQQKKIFVLGNWTRTYMLNPAGSGSIVETAAVVPPGDYQLPSVMYAAGKVLSLRADRKVALIDTSKSPPVVTATTDIDRVRYWANATVLPDGRVLVNGGSAVANELSGVAYTTQIWNPGTGTWTTGAAAAKPRLYHSIALLLPDGSVLTGSGGAPGPVSNLNMEIYYPNYLYRKDGSGQPAPRPTITAAPDLLRAGQSFAITMDSAAKINRVTIVRMGSATHSFNPDQRLLSLPFTQVGQQVQMTLPTNTGNLLPGYYMMFAIKGGVPSVAKIIKIDA